VTLPGTAWDAILPQWWFQQVYEPAVTFENATIFQRKAQLDRVVQPASLEFQPGLQLTGLLMSGNTLQPGTNLDVWLQFQVQQRQHVNYQPTLYLVNAHSEWYAITKDFPFGGSYDSIKWQPGDELEIPIRLNIPPDLPVGGYQIGLILFDPTLGEGVPLASSPELLSPDIRLSWLRLGGPPHEEFDTAVSLEPKLVWQQSLTLDSLNVGPADNGSLPVQLVWQVGQPVTRDLTTFVHLLDAQGNILTQVDERPFQGQWPTPIWQANETIFQPVNLPLPEDVSLDDVQLRVGLYDGEGRLPLADASGDFWQAPVALQMVLP
jgi:hypothetical protein